MEWWSSVVVEELNTEWNKRLPAKAGFSIGNRGLRPKAFRYGGCSELRCSVSDRMYRTSRIFFLSQFLDETGKENPSNPACPVGGDHRTGVDPV